MDFAEGDTDIWFTMGPKSRNPLTVRQLVEAGASVVRLGFSFGDHKLQTQRARMVRDAADATNGTCHVIADLPGEKIRLGDFGGRESIHLEGSETVTLVPLERDFDPTERVLPVEDALFGRTKVEDTLLVGDGSVSMDVIESDDSSLRAEVERGGTINPNRGVIVQGSDFEPESLTDEDVRHLRYVAESGLFDAVALSFVSSASEVERARSILDDSGEMPPVVSKIETRAGVENVGDICKASDAVMVARGDLALFLPWPELGRHVKRVVEAAQRTSTPWIMATQVAEALERFSFPTRAELCDLNRWVAEGGDGVLLSYETAFGSAPVDAVSRVSDVIDATNEAEQARESDSIASDDTDRS